MLVLYEELSKDDAKGTKTYQLIFESSRRKYVFLKETFRVRITVVSACSDQPNTAESHVWRERDLKWSLVHSLLPEQISTIKGLYRIDCTYRSFFADVHLLSTITKRILGLWSEMFDGQIDRRYEA